MTLRKRLIAAALGLPMLFSLLWLNWFLRRHGNADDVPLLGIVLLIAAGSGWEVSAVVRHRIAGFTAFNGLLAAVLVPLAVHALRLVSADATRLLSVDVLAINLLTILCAALLITNIAGDYRQHPAHSLRANLIVLLAGLYIGCAVSTLLLMGASFHHEITAGFVFVLVFALDTAAYFGGHTIKGPHLAPAISPGKTVAGAICGLLASVLMALLIKFLTRQYAASWWNLGANLSWVEIGMIGMAVGISGQLGDLIESLFKRWGGVKDSGTIIYGHGGFLDRFDSLFLAAPISYVLLLLFLSPAG